MHGNSSLRHGFLSTLWLMSAKKSFAASSTDGGLLPVALAALRACLSCHVQAMSTVSFALSRNFGARAKPGLDVHGLDSAAIPSDDRMFTECSRHFAKEFSVLFPFT